MVRIQGFNVQARNIHWGNILGIGLIQFPRVKFESPTRVWVYDGNKKHPSIPLNSFQADTLHKSRRNNRERATPKMYANTTAPSPPRTHRPNFPYSMGPLYLST